MTKAEQEALRVAVASGGWRVEFQEHPAVGAIRLFHLLLPFCHDRMICSLAIYFWVVGFWGLWTTPPPTLLVPNGVAP